MKNMYTSRFIMNVFVEGKLQRDSQDGVVTIPFGCEYKIKLTNKNKHRAVCKLSIDGENISAGGFVINANSSIEIERSVETDKKFLFAHIQSEAAYEQSKNEFSEKYHTGLIEAKFAKVIEDDWYEYKKRWEPPVSPYQPWDSPYNPWKRERPTFIGASFKGFTINAPDDTKSWNTWNTSSEMKCRGELNFMEPTSFSAAACNMTSAPGVTLEGSNSSQRFSTTYVNTENIWTTLRIKLRGYNPGEAPTQSQPRDKKGRFAPNYKEESDTDQQLHNLSLELQKLQQIKDLQDQIEKLKASI